MLTIDIKNVENLIFYDKLLHKKLPDFSNAFHHWAMCKRFPILKSMIQKSLLSFLENLKDEHIKILEEYFDTQVEVKTLDYHKVKNFKVPIKDSEELVSNLKTLYDNYSIYRDQDNLFITFWR